MVESFNSAMFDESSGISDDSTGSAADMFINLEYFLYGFRDNEGRVKSSFNSKDDSFTALDSDGR